MNPNECRSLGRCGVSLPQLGFGCAPIGELFAHVSEDKAQATLQAAWDGGIRYFDTSPWYGRGMSERRLGIFLAGKNRDEFIVSSKVGRILETPAKEENLAGSPWIGGDSLQHHFDYTYDGILRSYEDSLKRLQLDRIDLLLIHDLDFMHHHTDEGVAAHMRQLTEGGGWRALQALKEGGAIRGIGSGVNELGTIPRMLDATDEQLDFFLIALRYTLMEQETLIDELPRCAKSNIGIIVGGVFNSGILASGIVPGVKYNYVDPSPEVLDKVRRIEAVCAEFKVPMAAAALQFPLGHPSVASVIPGAVNSEQVKANFGNLALPILEGFWKKLQDNGLLRQDAPLPIANAVMLPRKSALNPAP